MKLKHYIIGILIIIIDQISKFLLINKSFTIIPNFLNFTYTENKGGAFGLGTINLITIFSIIIIIGVLIYIIHERKKNINFTPFILILSGSIGNLIDRIFRGFVVDFIDVNLFNFPNFNMADICIVLGFLIILINTKKNIIFNSKKDIDNKNN